VVATTAYYVPLKLVQLPPLPLLPTRPDSLVRAVEAPHFAPSGSGD